MLEAVDAAVYGALGGLLVEGVIFSGNVIGWQDASHRAARSGDNERPPMSGYIQPIPDLLAALTRALLGAVLGFAFHGQVTGALAAVAIGVSGPAVVAQLGATALSSRIGGPPRDPGHTT
jgi:hypothetical protein